MGKRKKDDSFLSKKSEEKRYICRSKMVSFFSKFEITRNRLNKDNKNFGEHSMVIIIKKLLI